MLIFFCLLEFIALPSTIKFALLERTHFNRDAE